MRNGHLQFRYQTDTVVWRIENGDYSRRRRSYLGGGGAHPDSLWAWLADTERLSGVKKCNNAISRRGWRPIWSGSIHRFALPSEGSAPIRKDVFEEELHIFLRDLRQYGTAADCCETEVNVPIISTPQGFNEEELYDLEPTFGYSLFLKCEG